MLFTHDERELRERFHHIMEPGLDLYDVPMDCFARAYLAFMTLDAENDQAGTNFKVRKVRVQGRNIHLDAE